MIRRRFQRGSIHKRGTRKKVWVARYSEDVIGPNGVASRIRRAEVLGTVAEIPTRRQAEQLLSERLRLVNSSEYRPSSSRTFRDYVENCWLPEMLPTLKYSTKRFYNYIWKVHLCPAFGEMQLRLINRDAVQLFIAEKLRSGLSWRTVKSLRTSFGTIMAANVWNLILPTQRRMIALLADGKRLDPAMEDQAMLRTRHNTYLSIPLIFLMLSSHFPTVSYGHRFNWAMLGVFVLLGWAGAHVMRRL
jgi:hypothetical protein